MPPKLIVEVLGDTSRLERSFKRASGEAKGLGASFGSLSIGLGQLVKGVVIVDAVQKALEGLHATVHLGIEEFAEHAKVSSQTEAALKSTGGVANVTAKQIDELGLSLSNLSGVDDEVIQSGANVLLAFQNIRDFAGKGNQIFTEATKAALDFAVRSGRSVPAAAVAIGRALQDPAKAAGSLRRAYVVLTGAEKAAIASAVAHGDILKAQRLIIADLNKRYGGAAEALGKTLPGQIAILRDRFKDLAGVIVGAVAPAATSAVTGLTDLVKKLSETKGFDAKINVVFDALGNAGNELAAKVRKQINSINWGTVPARIGLVVSTVGNAGKQLFETVRSQVAAIDWRPIFAAAKGLAEGFQARLEAIDWGHVGKTIGDGIAKGVAGAAGIVKPLAGKLDAAFRTAFASIDFNKLGRAAGPGLAAAMVSALATLLDPSFWIKNWDLALAIAATAFGDGLGRLAGKFAAPFVRLGAKLVPALARVGADAALGLLGAIERVAPRLADAFLSIGARGAQLLGRGLSALLGVADRALATLLGPFVRFYRRLSGFFRFTIKVLGIQAVIDEIAHLVATVGGMFGHLADKIGHALDGAWKGLEKGAIKAAIKIVEPFTHLPGFLGGDSFQKLQAKLKSELADMENPAFVSGKQVGDQVIAGINAGLKGPIGQPVIPAPKLPPGVSGPTVTPTISHRDRDFLPPSLPAPPVPTPPQRKGITAAQRNQFFDNAISSDLTRAGFITNIKAQIAALQQIAGLITARIAATKDVTRRRTLEDQLLGVQSQIKADQAQVGQDFLSSLQLGVTKAQATATFKDDLAALAALKAGIQAQIKATGDSVDLEQQLFDVTQQINAVHAQVFQQRIDLAQFRVTKAEATPGFADDVKALTALQDGIKAQIKATGDTLDLEQQLFTVQQQLAAARTSQRNAAQFKTLGLSATGDDIVPGVKRLKTELATLSTSITGTFLDTSKTQSIISNLRKVLSGSLGAVSQEVRAKVQSILDDLAHKLQGSAANLTKFSKANANALLAGLGLSPDQVRALRAKVSQLGVGGTVHGTGVGAFGVALSTAGAPIVVHTTVNLDGKKVASNTTTHQQRTRRRNPAQKRGPHAGGD